MQCDAMWRDAWYRKTAFNAYILTCTADTNTLESTANVATATDRCFTVPIEWKAIKMYVPDDRRGRLKPGWTTVMYEVFHGMVPTCSLTFTNNYLSAKGVWRADAQCRSDNNCVKAHFRMTVKECMSDDETVEVAIEVVGSCTHAWRMCHWFQ